MEWYNEESARMLSSGYFLPGENVHDAIDRICKAIDELSPVSGLYGRCKEYIEKGWLVLSSPVWSNMGTKRGLPVSCLVGNSWIHTQEEGGTQIKDIKVGDMVLTHKNRYRKVKKIQYRESLDDLFKLKVKTRMTPIKITGNHPVLTNLGWVRVDQLDPDVHLIATSASPIERVVEEYTIKFPPKPEKKHLSHFELTEIPNQLVDEDLAWCFGLWCGDGSLAINKTGFSGIRITGDMKERSQLERFFKIMQEKFGLNGNIYESTGTRKKRDGSLPKWLTLNVNSKVLAEWFLKEFGRYSLTKNIPLWLKNLPKNQLQSFYQGFYDADGAKTGKKKDKHVTISNPKMAMSLFEIGLNCGYRMGLQMQEKPGPANKTKYVYRVITYCKLGKINLSKSSARAGVLWSDGLRYCPFVLEKLTENQRVYDIEVEEDHSFVTSGVVVHNCNGSYVSDNITSILYTQAEIGMMTKLGAGTSAYFSDLRARGKEISGGGESDGPISFMQFFDKTMDIISQGACRRGAMAAYLDIDHPDIEEFLRIRTEGNPIQELHTGVCVSNDFMNRMIEGDAQARLIWAKVLKQRQEKGEPYIFFSDNVNNNKPECYKDRKIYASNLCCVAGDQLVVTSNGLVSAKELYETQESFTIFDGCYQQTCSKMHLINESAAVYKITLENGLTHKVTHNHKVKTKDGDKRLDELKIGDKISFQKKKGLFGNINRPKEAFLLGLYQSDGTQHKDMIMLDIWENDFDLIEEIESSFSDIHYKYDCDSYEITNQFGKTFSRGRSAATFHDCSTGTSTVKKKRLSSKTLKKALNFKKGSIPKWILKGDEKTQWSYIRGLLYADGTVFKSTSKGNPLQISYADINKQFLEKLQILLLNLGISCQIRILKEQGKQLLPDGKGGNKFYDCKTCYRLVIGSKKDALEIEKHTSFLSRKNISVDDREYRDNTKKFYSVQSIEKLDNEPVYCIEVNSEAHHWVCNGIITHNSEIHLPSNDKEAFVCCLSSLNLEKYDEWRDSKLVEDAIYFLDAVMQDYINKTKDITFMERAHSFAKNHRALGLGTLGLHSLFQKKMLPVDCLQATVLNSSIYKNIRQKANEASKNLCIIAGPPEGFPQLDRRNTTLMAVAPNLSSSSIAGQVSAGIEPFPANYFTVELAKGNFTRKNKYLVELLRAKGKLTAEVEYSILKAEGSVQHLDFLTEEEKNVFKTFSEINQYVLINQAADRQMWIDQGQSLNINIPPSVPVKEVNALIIHAWKSGIKCLYYQRSRAISSGMFNMENICKGCDG